MEIKIITIHAMHNPGSVLQAYALQKFLEITYDVKIIDYRPEYFFSENSKLKLILKKILYHRDYESRKKKFNQFISENMNLTKRYTTYNELFGSNMQADVFIVGSDQLWNSDFPCGNDPAFYLKFVNKGKKISFSTSVGKAIIDKNNLSILKKNLSDFDFLAVREKSTAELLSKILKRNVKWVCDPVFLLGKEHYLKFITNNSPISGRYVMIYLLENSDNLKQIIEFYKAKQLKIVLVGGFTKRCYCDLHIKDAGPLDFLNLIYHTEVVISGSFHATAFAHIFQKKFITLIPNKNGERILSLLEQTRLSNKAIDKSVNFDEIEKKINWGDVQNRLNRYIDSSKAYLQSIL